jgi:hypothetical protein
MAEDVPAAKYQKLLKAYADVSLGQTAPAHFAAGVWRSEG